MGLGPGDKALMYALGGLARGGATRGGYHSAKPFVSVGGIQRGTSRLNPAEKVLTESMVIRNVVDDESDTCTIVAFNFVPREGDEVIVTLGTPNSLTREFGGQILGKVRTYVDTPQFQTIYANAIDYAWVANHQKVIRRYSNMSGTDIAKDLVASFAPGFTTRRVQANLPTIDDISFTNVDLSTALTQLTKRLGNNLYWYWDYFRDLHLYADEELVTHPAYILDTNDWNRDVRITSDLSQFVSRVYMEGGGGSVMSDLAAGETIIPVDTATWYASTGGWIALEAQRVSYSTIFVGGTGTLVGPGTGPGAALNATATTGGTLTPGVYSYVYTFVTGAGESLPSPVRVFTLAGTLAAPASGPTFGSLLFGTDLDAGTHDYQYTFVTAAGETTPSPSGAGITVPAAVSAHPATTVSVGTSADGATNFWQPHDLVTVSIAYQDSSGHETIATPASNTVDAGPNINPPGAQVLVRPIRFLITRNSDSRVTGIRIYLKVNGTFVGWTSASNSTFTAVLGGVANFTPLSPSAVNTMDTRKVQITVPVGGATVTSRKVYRRFNGAGTFKLVATIADNVTTTFTDTATNASLGADAPSTNTATEAQIALTGIATGPTGTTSRKIYRTTVGGSQHKLQQTIANNTATSGVTDNTADGSLGANAPVGDTSGLTQPTGQVAQGATTIPMASPAPFESTGGWVQISSQMIRYTGLSGNTLTGIPTSGIGSVVSAIQYGNQALAAPALKGVPASGDGALLYSVAKGDEANILVSVEDPLAIDYLAFTLSTPTFTHNGIIEEYIIDNRLSINEALSRAQSTLELRNQIELMLEYETRDFNARAGRYAEVDVTDLQTTEIFHIQDVTITEFHPDLAPLRHVKAATRATKFTFDDLLRMARKNTAE